MQHSAGECSGIFCTCCMMLKFLRLSGQAAPTPRGRSWAEMGLPTVPSRTVLYCFTSVVVCSEVFHYVLIVWCGGSIHLFWECHQGGVVAPPQLVQVDSVLTRSGGLTWVGVRRQ